MIIKKIKAVENSRQLYFCGKDYFAKQIATELIVFKQSLYDSVACTSII